MLTKKILLGFSASLLMALPISTMIACSSTSDEKIDVEAAKFETSTNTKKSMTSQEAVSSIRMASTPEAKRIVLLEFASVPTLDKEFDYEVLSASIDNQVNSTVNIVINVFEISDKENNNKSVTYKVMNFSIQAPDIDTETEKFYDIVSTKRPNLDSIQAIEMINGKNPTEALAALKILADVPTLAEGFLFTVTGAAVSKTINTTIDVSIIVSRPITDETKNTTFRVAGFKPGINLDTEAGKFDRTIPTISPETAAESAVESIQNAVNALDKLEALKVFAFVPTLSEKFDFEVLSSQIDDQVKTTVNVEIRVFEKANPLNFKEVTFIVTGLTTLIDIQATKFAYIYTQTTSNPPLKAIVAVQRINLVPPNERVAALKTFTRNDLPVLDNGFAFEIQSANANNSVVNVIVRIFEINNQLNEKMITLQVTHFWDLSALDLQAIKFINTEETINSNITATQAIDRILASSNKDARIAALNLLANVPSVDAPNFDFEVSDAKLSRRDPNEVYVTITVNQYSGSEIWPTDIIFTINGFKPTL
ncbi:MAG: hypothetical protein ACRC7B_00195 [Metamycoplasmataceae bacterium]